MATAKERFLKLVEDTRRLQKQYFQRRTRDLLEKSKEIESRLEKALDWIERNPTKIRTEIAPMCRKMLEAQREFYRNKNSRTLQAAKAIERKVDKALADENDKQIDLWD